MVFAGERRLEQETSNHLLAEGWCAWSLRLSDHLQGFPSEFVADDHFWLRSRSFCRRRTWASFTLSRANLANIPTSSRSSLTSIWRVTSPWMTSWRSWSDEWRVWWCTMEISDPTSTIARRYLLTRAIRCVSMKSGLDRSTLYFLKSRSVSAWFVVLLCRCYFSLRIF